MKWIVQSKKNIVIFQTYTKQFITTFVIQSLQIVLCSEIEPWHHVILPVYHVIILPSMQIWYQIYQVNTLCLRNW